MFDYVCDRNQLAIIDTSAIVCGELVSLVAFLSVSSCPIRYFVRRSETCSEMSFREHHFVLLIGVDII